jgi:hypothetical protein
MTAMSRNLGTMASLTAVAALLAPIAASAQSVGYGDVTGDGASADGAGGDTGGDGGVSTKRERRAGGERGGRAGGKTIQIQPYLELNQIVDADLSSGGDVLTYTQAAAGVDAAIAGRNNALAASVRYEYHQGWSKRAGHGDSISGIVSGYTRVAPGLTLNVAGLAARTNDSGEGGGLGGGGGLGSGYVGDSGNSTVYAVQGGPSYVGRVGDLDLSANYRADYTKVTTDNDGRNTARAFAPDLFDESVTHVADAQAGFAPGTVLPVGIGAAGSFYQENVTNLDQRLRDMQARGIVTVPVSRTVQVSGAIGYEDVEVSAHDAVRGPDGAPIIRHGRYVTDKSGPRLIAYDTDGLIWDVGVSWRPSRRTSLTAHVGRRYGGTNYAGSFSWAPSARQTLSVGIYNTISAFGGNLGRVLDELPDDFVAVRNPISGELGGCVSSLQGNNCLTGAFTSLRSSTFRSRGIAASYNVRFGAIDAGLGIGYDNRKYIAAPGTVLAVADGAVDENYWLSANLNWAIDQRSGLYTNAYADLSKSDAYVGDISNVGITTAYYRNLTNHLRAHAALGIDGTLGNGEFDDYWNASALVGMRYNF